MNIGEKPWIPHVTVASIIQRKESNHSQYLMVEEKINGKLVINQAAGHWENNESILEAIQRETLEETSYKVDPVSLVGIYSWTIPEDESNRDSTDTFLRFTFHCNVVSKTENPLDPDINRYLWLTEHEIRSEQYAKRSPLVLKSLDDFLANKSYPLDLFCDLK